ncbi:protein kinase domain-containing protein [Angustibacter sp. McL0619]|uniref:protein kinase domain-containing protein n=1 Tax=Angustibacter sp. McL0619 TaxID=3415676 RepID=UPI003CEBF8C0
MSQMHPEPGLRVVDRYQLTSRIAIGGMGEVWRARDEVLGREVAVKLLRREYAQDETFLARFRSEALHAASLSHPGIASVYDYGEVQGTAYLVMELVDGEPLSAWLARQGALPAETAVPLIQQAAAALQAAHDGGVVHRDVKPANLLITPDETLKITDFGIARAGDQLPITRTGEVMGTVQYLSPEQAVGQTATPLSDVYALGVVAYETLAGRRPFDHDTAVATALAQVNDDPDPLPETVPPRVADVVMWSMEKNPAHRPQSAAELGSALGSALAGLSAAPATAAATQVMPAVVAPPPTAAASTITPADESPDHRTRNIVIAVLAVLVVAALVALAVNQFGQDDTQPPTGPGTSTSAPTTTRTTSSSSTTSTPDEITLDPADYVGRPADEVEAELKGLGLEVKKNSVRDNTAQKNTVVGLSPTSGLAKGDTVTLDVARGGRKQEPTTTTSSTTTSSTTTSPPSASDGPPSSTAGGTGNATDPTSTEAAG